MSNKPLPGSCFFFYVRPAQNNGMYRPPLEGEIEFHLMDKISYFSGSEGGQCNPFHLAYELNIDLSPIGELNDSDGNISWWQGDAHNAQIYLISLGMTELQDLADNYDHYVAWYIKDRDKRHSQRKI